MRYNPPVQRTQADANKWLGQMVETTRGVVGCVSQVWLSGNVIEMLIDAVDGSTWYTNNEHATIIPVRDGS